jgi:hypothetical protein
MAVDLASGRKIKPLLGVRGARPSWTASLWGREGVTFAISIPAQKTRGDFSIPFFPQTMEIAAGYPSPLVIFTSVSGTTSVMELSCLDKNSNTAVDKSGNFNA